MRRDAREVLVLLGCWCQGRWRGINEESNNNDNNNKTSFLAGLYQVKVPRNRPEGRGSLV
jgi:hypothetical protein